LESNYWQIQRSCGMNTVIVTTSWDDGHKLDLKLARLLKKYGITATFYISPKDREFVSDDLLDIKEIKDLSNEFEIGAHTMTHPLLTHINSDNARQEIVDSKAWLEKFTGKKVQCFCYPAGAYTAEHVNIIKNTGFIYARTVRRFLLKKPHNYYEADTAIHAYRHWSDMIRIFRFAGFNLFNFWRYLTNWDSLAKAMFDQIIESGGVFHLWGHSWEIDSKGDWARLETVLAYISGRSDVQYITNGELACLPNENSSS
jgi:peptidoglycan-N-acetylglucosamine deacetylase